MTINPHPVVMTAIVRHRLEEFQGQAARDRLANHAVGAAAARRQAWIDLLNAAAVILVLALLIAAGSAVAREPASLVPHHAAAVVAQTDATVNLAQTVRASGD